mmetsp:Transcript_79828/g.150803  ORF Transcript_79828/g.150803 Transcript_79828/m.150803 type:complete len:116 (+) Transcript_79828:237-584(+)
MVAVRAEMLTHSCSQSPSVFHVPYADTNFCDDVFLKEFEDWLQRLPYNGDNARGRARNDEINAELLPQTVDDFELPENHTKPSTIHQDPKNQHPVHRVCVQTVPELRYTVLNACH